MDGAVVKILIVQTDYDANVLGYFEGQKQLFL